ARSHEEVAHETGLADPRRAEDGHGPCLLLVASHRVCALELAHLGGPSHEDRSALADREAGGREQAVCRHGWTGGYLRPGGSHTWPFFLQRALGRSSCGPPLSLSLPSWRA